MKKGWPKCKQWSRAIWLVQMSSSSGRLRLMQRNIMFQGFQLPWRFIYHARLPRIVIKQLVLSIHCLWSQLQDHQLESLFISIIMTFEILMFFLGSIDPKYSLIWLSAIICWHHIYFSLDYWGVPKRISMRIINLMQPQF